MAIGLAVVVRQRVDHLGEAIDAAAFDFLRDFQMQGRARALQQTLVQGVAHQSVLELVLAGFRIGADQPGELHGDKPSADIAGIIRDRRQQLWIETPADDRRRLQQCAIFTRETIDARREEALNRRRQRGRDGVGVEFHAFARGAQFAPFRQKTDDLFGEKRIAFGLVGHLLSQIFRQNLNAQSPFDQASNVSGRKGLHVQFGHDSPASPRRRILGSARVEQQQRQVVALVRYLAQHLLRHAVDPVKILDQQNDRREAATRLDQTQQQIPRSKADQHAIETVQRAFRRLKPQQIEKQPHMLQRTQSERVQARLKLSRHLLLGFADADLEQVAHDLDERHKRRLLAVLRAVSR